ncbi:MAG: hypothetical protein IJN43_07260 [Ruminococcus sp.]|nr:hypothetical protein [Ruminococcus sp.]
MENIKEYFNEIEKLVGKDALFEAEEKLVALLNKSERKESYIKDILELMEKNPLTDWGMPGALVHFVEACDDEVYKKLLLESVMRCPTVHTLWMLNREYNGRSDSELQEYLSVLKKIANDSSLHQLIINTAKEFLEFQISRKNQ